MGIDGRLTPTAAAAISAPTHTTKGVTEGIGMFPVHGMEEIGLLTEGRLTDTLCTLQGLLNGFVQLCDIV